MAPYLNTAEESFTNANIFLAISVSFVPLIFFIFACTKCKKENENCRQSNGQTRELPQVPPENENVEAVYTEVNETVNQGTIDANIYESVPGDTPNQSGSGVVTGRIGAAQQANGHAGRFSREQPNAFVDAAAADPNGAPPVIPEKSEDAKIVIEDSRETVQAVPPSRTGNICEAGKEPPYSDISARESLSSLREREAQQQILAPTNNTVYEVVEDQQGYDVIKEPTNDYTTQIYSEINEEQDNNYDQVPANNDNSRTVEEVKGATGGSETSTTVLKREALYSKVNKNKEKRKTAPPSSSNEPPIYSVVNKQRDRSLKTKSATPETLQDSYNIDGDYSTMICPQPSNSDNHAEPPYATVADSIENEERTPNAEAIWQKQDHIYQEIGEKNSPIRNTRV